MVYIGCLLCYCLCFIVGSCLVYVGFISDCTRLESMSGLMADYLFYVRFMICLCLVNVWYMLGLCLVSMGFILGSWLDHVWFMSGLMLVNLGFLFGLCLVRCWFTFVIYWIYCLSMFWFIVGSCLVYVSFISDWIGLVSIPGLLFWLMFGLC